jgi:hypothetical protein
MANVNKGNRLNQWSVQFVTFSPTRTCVDSKLGSTTQKLQQPVIWIFAESLNSEALW